MKRILIVMAASSFSLAAWAQKPPLLPEKDVAALANELSGETAKRNLEGIARFHRQRGSRGFHDAAELVVERLRAYGLSDIAIVEFPADGKIFYGTQRSRPAWDAEKAELWQVAPDIVSCDEAEGRKPMTDAEQEKVHPGFRSACDAIVDREIRLVGSYEAAPIVLAEDSESADVTADLVDVGAGTMESDYAGKNVKGKIVLVSAQPGAVQDLAVGRFRAAGIVSYAQNQKTAWSGEDENLIRWGHLETFSEHKTFAFMVSLKTAREMKEWLVPGKNHGIRLHAVVKAGQHAGNYEVATATIRGADLKLKNEEIAFSCHLDHQRPGANDNASGCVTILEVARTLQHLINEGKLARPARTIRFIFPPEIEGTLALMNAEIGKYHLSMPGANGGLEFKSPDSRHDDPLYMDDRPALRDCIKAVVHMDMVGGGPETKAVFHVTRGPMSLPSFVHDVAWAFAEFVNEESYKFAATGEAKYPFVAPEGGKEPLRAEYSAYTMGSDHDVYQDSSFGIPAIYLNDWPDRYIHTNFDTARNIDPTKLKRAAFIGAASGYFLANRSNEDLPVLWGISKRGAVQQQVFRGGRNADLTSDQRFATNLPWCLYETQVLEPLRLMINALPQESREGFTPDMPKCWTGYAPVGKLDPKLGEAIRLVFRRRSRPKGPLAVFGYDYFADHAKASGVATPKLLSYEGLWGSGEEYGFEVLNFADGKRNAWEIRDAVSAEYGPVPLGLVVEYLRALEKINVVEQVK
jgi:hypothetical protein